MNPGLALGVVDRGRQEAAVVHRFPLRERLGVRLLDGFLREAGQGRSAKARDKEVRVRDFI